MTGNLVKRYNKTKSFHGKSSMKKKKRYVLICIAVVLMMTGCSMKKETQSTMPELLIGGTIYAPYFYKDINGEYAGIDVEIAREACRRIHYTPVFKEIEIADRFVSLRNKEVDCIWSCLSMEGRRERYQWAGPYMYSQRVVVVHEDSQIQSLLDLQDKRVAVQAGSTSEQIILDGANSDFPEVAQLTCFRSLNEVFTALRKGYVDAVVGHEGSLQEYTKEYPGEYRFLNMSLRSEPLGAAFRKEDARGIAEQLNQAFQEMKEDGTMEAIAQSFDLDVNKNVYGGALNGETDMEE